MSTPDRYTGPGRRGANRPMTADEKTAWQAAVENWHDDPPWTEQARQDNATVRTMLVTLFEDAVSLTELAQTAGWGKPKIAGVLHRARMAGLGTGSRRYIEPTPTAKQSAKAAKAPFRRPMTEQERTALVRLYDTLPRHAGGARGWKTENGTILVTQMQTLVAENVALESIGEALGMTRQAVHLRLKAAQKVQAAA